MIGEAPVRVAVEAGVKLGWERFIGENGVLRRPARLSAPAPPTTSSTPHFGVTPERVAEAAKARLAAG
ncbi:MAG: hypothetical protein WDM92_16430 [Caulobacteraceae bacterium]